MKYILCVVAVASLAAPVAFGQTGTQRDFVERGTGAVSPDARPGIFLLSGNGDAPEVAILVAAIRKELERSRHLRPAYVDAGATGKLLAPLEFQKNAAGDTMTVKFRVSTARRATTEGEVSCAIAKLANCARDIVTRADRFLWENRYK